MDFTNKDNTYWLRGADKNFQKIEGNPTKPTPAFNYSELTKNTYAGEIMFNPDNWNDRMMTPLRDLLWNFLNVSDTPKGWTELPYQEMIPPMWINDAKTISIASYWEDDESSWVFYFKAPGGINTTSIFMHYYKNRGTIENITDCEGQPIALLDMNDLYHVLGFIK